MTTIWTPTDDMLESAVDTDVELREILILEAFQYHRERDRHFDEFSEKSGFSGSLETIPLLSSGVFKHYADLIISSSSEDFVTTSSGTMGTISRVPRCDLSLMRFFGGLRWSVRTVSGIENSSFPVALLSGPTSPEEPSFLGYVVEQIGAVFDAVNLNNGSGIDSDRTTAFVEASKRFDRVGVVGPPAAVKDFSELVARRGGSLPAESIVFTVGGWKNSDGAKLSRVDFESVVAPQLGICEDRLRDIYGMVELNSIMSECIEGRKHIPPWVFGYALDPIDGHPLDSGESGVLAFLDPTAVSYPCFLLTDDVGIVTRDAHCPCGLEGDLLVIERRVNRAESRGCAQRYVSQ